MNQKVVLNFFLSGVLFFASAFGQQLRTPLDRNSYERVTTHEELLSFLKEVQLLSSSIRVDTIGRSAEGRAIPLVHILPPKGEKTITVFLFCQQHGNEPSGKEAALELLRMTATNEKRAYFPQLDLYIIPSANPDGNESGKRANANKADLNRDHLLLSQPETQAIHSVFSRLTPEVTLDVHEFAAYRKEFLAAGYVRAADEQFGAPTNVNIPLSIRDFGLKQLFPFLDAELSKENLRFANYLKMDEPSDTVRPSTTSIDDGRQSFAILNTFSFILEGRNGRNFNDDLKRRSKDQLTALLSFLRFVQIHAKEIKTLIQYERKKMLVNAEPVFIRMDYPYAGGTVVLPMKSLTTNSDTAVSMKYAPEVKTALSVQRPKAYLIPQSQTMIIEFLTRHKIGFERIQKEGERTVEIYTIDGVRPVWMENKPFVDVAATARNETVKVYPGDVLVPLAQPTSTMLVIALEPSSMWGLIQSEEFSFLRSVQTKYPIYRITE